MAGRNTQQGAEIGVPLTATVEAEDEFVETGLKVLAV
jgi:hypothetical protein